MALRPRDFKSLAGTPKLLVQNGFYPFSKPYVQENVQVFLRDRAILGVRWRPTGLICRGSADPVIEEWKDQVGLRLGRRQCPAANVLWRNRGSWGLGDRQVDG